MKKWIAGMGILVLLTACATDEEEQTEEAEADAPESEEEQTVEGEGGGFLWKIEEGDTTVYLQGTIHTAFADMYPLNAELEAAYDEADVLLPEIDWPRMDPSGGLNEEEMMDLITFDDDTLLEDVIDEEMYEEIVTIMEAQGMPEEMVNSLEPWYITSGLQEEEEGNATFDAGVDWHYLERAVEDGKEIEELEGQIISLLALNEQSLELQLEQLEDVMNPEDVDMPDVDGDDLVEMWLAGEEEPLIEYWEEVTYGEEYDRVYLWDRNERNADIIDEILQEDDGQTYLALIGAFHFFIEPGVQDFLEERGYTVERIN